MDTRCQRVPSAQPDSRRKMMKMNHASCSNNWVLHLNLSKQQDVTGQDELQSMPPASSAVLQVVDLKATRTRPSSCASPQQQPTLQFSGPAACRNSTPAAAHLPALTGYCCCTESRAQRSDTHRFVAETTTRYENNQMAGGSSSVK